MRFLGRPHSIAALTALALLASGLAAGGPALAQGVTGFQLPPGTASPAPRPAGPIDPENPIIRPRPSATEPAAAQPSPNPSIAASPITGTSPVTGTSPTPRTPRVAATSRARPVAAAPSQITAQAGPTASETALPAATIATAIPTATDTPPTTLPSAEPEQPARNWLALWPWAAGALTLLLMLAGAGWWLRRRQQAEPVVEFEPPVIAAPPPIQLPEPPPVPAKAPIPVAEPLPASPAKISGDPLTLSLTATRLSATLLNTTLQYTIELTNGGKSTLGPVTVAADMIAAHASKPVEQQLGLDGIVLEQRHQLESLKPGETASFSGEIRLPLTMVTPIRSGDAAFFVPLARFQIEAARKRNKEPLKLARNFVVGELPDINGAALRPFRLDLGPRIYSRIGQRELAQPA